MLGVESQGTLALAEGRFILKGRADRIDLLPDGTAAIIDYKTGGVPTKKDVVSGYEPQLPLLALLVEGGCLSPKPLHVSEIAYWKLSGGRAGEKTDPIKGDITELMNTARLGLEDLLTVFADPNTPYHATPKPNFALRYDDYAHLARVGEWGR